MIKSESQHDLTMWAHSPEGQPHPETWGPVSSSGALSTGKTWTCWSRSRGGCKNDL